MKKRMSSPLLGGLIIALLSLIATDAFAQQNSTAKADKVPQQTPIELNALIPAVRPNDGFAITRPNDIGHLNFAANLIFNAAYLPYSITAAGDEGPIRAGQTKKFDKGDTMSELVRTQVDANLGLSFGLVDRLSIDLLMPFTLFIEGDEYGYDSAEALKRKASSDKKVGYLNPPKEFKDKIAPGDARIGVRGRIWGSNDDDLSLGAYVGAVLPTSKWIPLGEKNYYRGNGKLGAEVKLLGEYRFLERARVDLNLGYTYFAPYPDTTENKVGSFIVDGGGVFRGAVGGAYDFLEDRNLSVHVELISSVRGFDYPETERKNSPVSGAFAFISHLHAEALAGAKYFTSFGLYAGLAVGRGFALAAGTPAFRALFTLGYQGVADPDTDGDGIKDSLDKCPTEPEDFDGYEDEDGCPDLDNDGDGIEDSIDQCPNEPEDLDGFEDEDGCPDPDNDADGIPDIDDACPDEAGIPEKQGCPFRDADGDGIEDEVDKCPTEPEDKDGWQDEDGCPDPDNDGDGILDANDKCPNEAGPASNQGCPIQDRDGDGIPDDVDKCPDEPETFNGNKDEDGCPDGKATVVVTQKEIKINDTIYFANGKSDIKRQSFKLLDTVASVLNRYDQITKILIAGHTDDVGNDSSNLQLSKDRAQSVLTYLTSKGVDPGRLTSEGFGGTEPTCTDIPELTKTKKDARRNRKKIKECRAANRRVEFRVTELNNKPVEATEQVTVVEKVEEKEAPIPDKK